MNLQEKYFYHNMERGKGALNLVAKLENKQTNRRCKGWVRQQRLGRQAMR